MGVRVRYQRLVPDLVSPPSQPSQRCARLRLGRRSAAAWAGRHSVVSLPRLRVRESYRPLAPPWRCRFRRVSARKRNYCTILRCWLDLLRINKHFCFYLRVPILHSDDMPLCLHAHFTSLHVTSLHSYTTALCHRVEWACTRQLDRTWRVVSSSHLPRPTAGDRRSGE